MGYVRTMTNSSAFYYHDGSGWKTSYVFHAPRAKFDDKLIWSEGEEFETKTGGILIPQSQFANPWNVFDVAGHGPALSTGRWEKPVNHRSFSATLGPSHINGMALESYSNTDPGFSEAWAQTAGLGTVYYDEQYIGNKFGCVQICERIAEFGVAREYTFSSSENVATLDYYRTSDGKYVLYSQCRCTFDGTSWTVEARARDGSVITTSPYLAPEPVTSGGTASLDDVIYPDITGYSTEIRDWYASAYLQAGQEAASYDVNNLENLFSAKETAGLVHPEMWLPRKGQNILKWISSTYLAWSYGLRPMVSDVQASLKLVADASVGVYLPSRIVRYSSATFGDMECHLKISLKNPHGAQEFTDVGSKALQASMALDPTNLWDLVPYSFIVDWILPIGDALERISTFNDMSRRWEFEYASISRKRTTQTSQGLSSCVSKTYDRHILDAPPSRLAVMAAARGSGINVPSAIALGVNIFL